MATDTPIQERVEAAEARAAELRTAIATKLGAGESFDTEAIALASAVAAHRELFKESNSAALSDETSQLALTIQTLVGASKLGDLLGEPVTSVYWNITPGSGENGPTMSCSINVKARAPSTRAPGSGGGSGGKGGSKKTPTFIVDGSEPMSATDFVVNHGPAEVQDNSLVKLDADGHRKWPTKPVFLDQTQKHLEESSHQVERIEPA